MQTSEVISVNLWQIVISLVNLVILFFILKRFLFKPVKGVLDSRRAKIDEQYKMADEARTEAHLEREELKKQLDGARQRADEILNEASATAEKRKREASAQAKREAENIISQAKLEAERERQLARDDIREQIVKGSTLLAQRLIEREINEKDHHSLIDSFIKDMGDEASEK